MNDKVTKNTFPFFLFPLVNLHFRAIVIFKLVVLNSICTSESFGKI